MRDRVVQLREAGWSRTRIAAELSITEWQVRKAYQGPRDRGKR